MSQDVGYIQTANYTEVVQSGCHRWQDGTEAVATAGATEAVVTAGSMNRGGCHRWCNETSCHRWQDGTEAVVTAGATEAVVTAGRMELIQFYNFS